MIQLYSTHYCPYALRTRLVLREKGLDFDHIEIDLKNKPQNFLEISPYGKVPALVDGDARIYESAIINEYLEEKYENQTSLMPKTPEGKAYVRIWVDFANTRLMPAGFRARRGPEEKRPEARKEFLEHLKTVEKVLGEKTWLAGDQYTLAEITFAPVFAMIDKAQEELWKDVPMLKNYWKRIKERPGYQATGGLEKNHE